MTLLNWRPHSTTVLQARWSQNFSGLPLAAPVTATATAPANCDLVALRRVWAEPFATRQQKMLQSALVLLVPIFGAYGIIIFLKHGKDFDRGDFPKAPGINRNITGTRID